MSDQKGNIKARIMIFLILILLILVGSLIYINLGYKPLFIYMLFLCLFCILFSLFKVLIEIRHRECQEL